MGAFKNLIAEFDDVLTSTGQEIQVLMARASPLRENGQDVTNVGAISRFPGSYLMTSEKPLP